MRPLGTIALGSVALLALVSLAGCLGGDAGQKPPAPTLEIDAPADGELVVRLYDNEGEELLERRPLRGGAEYELDDLERRGYHVELLLDGTVAWEGSLPRCAHRTLQVNDDGTVEEVAFDIC